MPPTIDAALPDGEDPIDSTDPAALRQEILRLRDVAIGEQSRCEVLADRILELEGELHALGAANEDLAAELARTPLSRLARRLRRLARGR